MTTRHTILSDRERVQTKGVRRLWIKRYLRNEIAERDACLALPWAILLVLFFILSTSTHFRTDVLRAINTAHTSDIEENANFAFSGNVPYENGRMGFKSIYDVNSIP